MAASTRPDQFLRRLAQLIKENERYFSLETCRDRYNALQGEEKSALKRLAGILRGRRQKKTPSLDDADSSPEYDDDNASEYCSVSQDSASASENDAPEREVNQSEDGSVVAVEESLLGTNFERCSADVPRSLRKILRDCRSDPEAFFKELHQTLPRAGSFGIAFCKIRRHKQQSDLRIIHRRFDLRNFYLKVIRSGHHTGKSWRWKAQEELAEEIKNQQSLDSSVSQIAEELSSYVELGRGYDAWVQTLGDPGYLIALPPGVSETE